MKRLGLLGGLSWVSTLDYYRYINEGVNRRLGGLEFAECLVYSVNFNDIQRHGWGDWERTFATLAEGCGHLKAGGAQALVLCANTAHVLADRLEAATGLPLVHIADATAVQVQHAGLRKVGLLGTKFTMELPFFRDKLAHQGIECLVPAEQATLDFIQQTLRDELGRGLALPATKAAYLRIVDTLLAQGAQGIVLGCTELSLLLGEGDIRAPVFDTTRIHAEAAVDFALGDTMP